MVKLHNNGTIIMRLSLLCLVCPAAVTAVAKLRIVSPLQALTIWDKESTAEGGDTPLPTWRSRFLPRYKKGLEAEAAVQKELAGKRDEELKAIQAAASASNNKRGWAQRAADAERNWAKAQDQAAEAAFDQATREYDAVQNNLPAPPKNPNQYQFVGVIRPSTSASSASSSPITWYARPKPASAKWTVRLVHMNQRAILKDLFGKGKVDVFCKYRNTGQKQEASQQPVIVGEYTVRERSWRNLWNFSPKHFFTDSSGMYWRERRLRPGLYTDGETVYESTYRYRDGRNGMHKKSTLDTLLQSSSIPVKTKRRLQQRLASDAPDVVLED